MVQLALFADVAAFLNIGPEKRLTLAAPLAELLGAEFRPHASLVGDRGMVAVDHLPTGLCFVAVPGGDFEMGLSETDVDDAARYIPFSAGVQRSIQLIEASATPVHRVTIAPFLIATRPLEDAELVESLSGDPMGTPVMRPDKAIELERRAAGFRLPSEAELEYVHREAGAVHFVNDGARIYSSTHRWPRENGWGLQGLNAGAWAGDEWHDDYRGAPSTSARWSEGGVPGVFRGCLPYGPDQHDEQLIFGLAACRGQGNVPGDIDVYVRLARSIDLA